MKHFDDAPHSEARAAIPAAAWSRSGVEDSPVLRKALGLALRLARADAAWIELFERDQARIALTLGHLEGLAALGPRVFENGGGVGTACVIGDPASCPALHDHPLSRREPPLAGLVAFPLIPRGGAMLGALCVIGGADVSQDMDRLGDLSEVSDLMLTELLTIRENLAAVEAVHTLARYNDQRFRDLADSMPLIVWTATPDGNVNYFGRPLVDYSGVPMEVLDQPGYWLQLLHPDDRDACIETWTRSVTTGEAYSIRFRIRRHDGAYRWFWVSAVPHRDAGGEITIWYGAAADIDDEFRLERQSRVLAERLAGILGSIPDAYLTLDVAGRLAACNDAAIRLFGIDPEFATGRPFAEAVPALRSSGVPARCEAAMRDGQTQREEIFLKRLGTWFDVAIFPSPAGVSVFLRDISGRVHEQTVRSAEARVLGLITSAASLDEMLQETVLAIEAALPGMIGSILLYDADTACLRHGVAPGLPDSLSRAIDGQPIGPMAGSCGTAVYTRQPVIVRDIASDPRWAGYRDLALPFRLRACWSVPVLDARGQVLATLAMYYREAREPRSEEMDLILRMARLVAIAITRSREQEALRASEERLRGMFRDAATGIAVTDHRGHFLDANRAYCDMLGYPVETLRTLDFRSITHPDDRPHNELLIKELLSGARSAFVIEKRYITREGRIVWARLSVTAQRRDERVERLVAVAEDVTVRHLAEEALFHQSMLLTMASRMGELGGWMIEVPSFAVTWSDELRQLLEVSPDYEPGLEDSIALYTDDCRQAVTDSVQACAEHGIGFDIQADIVSMRGRLLHVRILGEAVRDERGVIVRVQGTFQNVSAQHKLMADLAESEARFRELAENIQEVFWMRVPDDNRILYISPAYEKIWGHSCEELYADPATWMDSIHPDDVESVRAAVGDDPAAIYRAEYRIRRPDGEERWIADTGFPVFDADGRVARITGIAHDITDRKRAEVVMRDTMERLSRSNRELEDFVYVASHDLQEPLRKIKVFADRLRQRDKTPGEGGLDHLARIVAAADRMQTLIQDLLEYSRVTTQARPMVAVALDEVVAAVLDDLEVAIAESGASVERAPLPVITGDARQMQQLLQNLLSNALKFRHADVAPQIRIFCERDAAGDACLCVEDNGIGIDPAHIGRIFRPFQRLHGRDEYPGSGIGLAIVKKIADRHDADLSVASTPGKGSVFRVRLPRSIEGG